MPHLLETINLGCNFDGFEAIKNVGFSVQQGEIHAIIGPNGAGKTTFFGLIFGEITPSSGKIFFKGKDITRLAPWQICRLGIGRSYQITNVFPQLTVHENIRMAFQSVSVVYNFWSSIMAFTNFHEKALDIVSEIGLELKTWEAAANLSHGEQRSLEIGLSLASKPELLLLDEPTAGMSMEETKHMVGLIKTVAAERDLTILIVEHKMDVVYAIADRVTVLQRGSILATGTPEEIRDHEEVKSAYLRGGRNDA